MCFTICFKISRSYGRWCKSFFSSVDLACFILQGSKCARKRREASDLIMYFSCGFIEVDFAIFSKDFRCVFEESRVELILADYRKIILQQFPDGFDEQVGSDDFHAIMKFSCSFILTYRNFLLQEDISCVDLVF